MPGTQAVNVRLELGQEISRLLDRHLCTAREWFPHQWVPWGQGHDFDGPLGGIPWSESQSQLPRAVRSALVVNLLTEDNLPGYHHALLSGPSEEGPMMRALAQDGDSGRRAGSRWPGSRRDSGWRPCSMKPSSIRS
ncbi:acyl-ACP desaturase [Streptomyces sp. ISL-11]|uniref:acyl-ACP desaturase n=1 Tax=Streptomyces sp. ISL-11 TaxID=2819174 RepID=UPI001BE98EBF|nr:acyl-ACP desaturase [Streptomyces sp. ISL-11]MBT2386619.1 acyl-ACP desaturase [Streptomyces sp. ISL-11]